MVGSHLWEVKHAYYMSEGNYFALDCHTHYKSWGEFLSAFGDSDMDLNYVVRWDWREGDDWGLRPYEGDDYYRYARLLVQFVGQRKASLWSAEVDVCRADEPAIKAWLQPRFEYAMNLWAPFSPNPKE